VLNKLLNKFCVKERQDFSDLYTELPISFAEEFPEVPKPAPRLSPKLLSAQWVCHDLRAEELPAIAADLLEAGEDTPSLRRLAGETQVSCSADVEELVGKTFRELGISYPVPENEAKIIVSRQIAREVIHGKRNAWAAASHLEFGVRGWQDETPEVQSIFGIHEALNWSIVNNDQIPALTEELIRSFGRLGARAEGEKRIIRFGLLEGKGRIADDFDAPLPDEILAQFEGRDEPSANE